MTISTTTQTSPKEDFQAIHDFINVFDNSLNEPRLKLYDSFQNRGTGFIKLKTALKKLKGDWAGCNVLFQLGERWYKSGLLKWSAGVRLDFDSGFASADELYAYLSGMGLPPSLIVQTHSSRFHAFLCSPQCSRGQFLTSLVGGCDPMANTLEIKVPGSVSKGDFQCVLHTYPVVFINVDGWVKDALEAERKGVLPSSALPTDNKFPLRCVTPLATEENNELDQAIKVDLPLSQAVCPLDQEPNKSITPEDNKPNKPKSKFKPTFTKAIAKKLKELKAGEAKGKATHSQQAKYLSDNLGYLNYGNHGIAISTIQKTFKVAENTAINLRKAWMSMELIERVSRSPNPHISDRFKTGEALKNLTNKKTKEQTIDALDASYELKAGTSYQNGVHWYRDLRNAGMEHDEAIETIKQWDRGTNRDWDKLGKTFVKRFREVGE